MIISPFSMPWLEEFRSAPEPRTPLTKQQLDWIEERRDILRQQVEGGAQDRQAITVELIKLLAVFPGDDNVPFSDRLEELITAAGDAPEWSVAEACARLIENADKLRELKFDWRLGDWLVVSIDDALEPFRRDLQDLEKIIDLEKTS